MKIINLKITRKELKKKINERENLTDGPVIHEGTLGGYQ